MLFWQFNTLAALARPGRARPGHPRGAASSCLPKLQQRHGVDGRDKPGQDGAGCATQFSCPKVSL